MAEDNNRQKRNITGSYPGVTGSYNSPKRQEKREFTTPDETRRMTPHYDFTKKAEKPTASEPTRVQKKVDVDATAPFKSVKNTTPPASDEFGTRVDTPKVTKTDAMPPKSEQVKKSAEPPTDKSGSFDIKEWFSRDNVKRFFWQLAFYVSILIISILLTFGIVTVANDVFAFVKPDESIVVTLEQGSSTESIAKTLKEAGVIKHPTVFKLYSKIRHADGKYQYGDYTLNSNLGYDQIIAALQKTSVQAETVTFTVHVGCTQDEFIDMLTAKKYFTALELDTALNDYRYEDYEWVQKLPERRCRLEGYIMAGDYEIAVGESAVSLVEKVLGRFEDTVLTAENQKLINESDLSTDEIITFASILQKECATPAIYKPAAAVIYNRLNAEVPVNLQLVSPINYVLPEPKATLSLDDKRTDSDYNTYKHVGLPLGPICAPSYEAINAVLMPESSINMYFISDGEKSYFAANAAEHEENLNKASKTAKGTDTIR